MFSAPMMRAVLAGDKTQTRRIMKPQPDTSTPGYWAWSPRKGVSCGRPGAFVYGPYGVPGDRLWIREGLKLGADDYWYYAADNKQILLPNADDERVLAMRVWVHHKQGGHCPSMHMPRWASRKTIEITAVRPERLQEITERDARAEGTKHVRGAFTNSLPHGASLSNREAFAKLWDGLNGKRAPWESNPWLWVVTFKTIEGSI